MAVRNMPRDVRTRWNSTYSMLAFAIEYKPALKKVTADQDLGLRKFELTTEEWEIAEALRDVLKASHVTGHICDMRLVRLRACSVLLSLPSSLAITNLIFTRYSTMPPSSSLATIRTSLWLFQ